MNYNLTQVKELLEKIDFSIFDRPFFCSNFIEEELNFQCFKNIEITIEYGVSKLVLIPKNYNFVIKIPFLGTLKPGHHYYELEFDKTLFIPFNNAFYPLTEFNEDEKCWNYCRSEEEFFQLAKKENLDMFFCETKYVTTIHHIPIYISEKAIPYDSITKRISREEQLHTKKIIQNFTINPNPDFFSLSFLSLMLRSYNNTNLVQHFLNFLCKYGITDLHMGNYGVTCTNQTFVLIDYSDFCD